MTLKALHKKNLVNAKKIIVDSITDHLIPQVSSPKDTQRDVWFLDQAIWREEHKSEDDFEKTVEEYEDQNAKTMQSYFTRVSQFKEQLEAVEEEVENAEVTLNGLPRSWDSFIRGMCAKRKWLLSANSGKKKKLDS